MLSQLLHFLSSFFMRQARSSFRSNRSASLRNRTTVPRINSAKSQFQSQFPYLPLDESQLTILPGRIDGFLGIPWGSSAEEALGIMLERPNVKFEDVITLDGRNTIEFSGGTFGLFSVSQYVLRFVNDALFCGEVFLPPEQDTTFLEHWYVVKAELSSKYGVPPIDRKEFKSPYVEGDGHEEKGFLTGNAKVFCEWDFDNIGNRVNTIMMFIDDPRNPMLHTIVTYVNNDLLHS